MCNCGKGCSEGCVPTGPMGPPGPKGDPGTNGTNGISIIASFVSDGVTAIGNVIYPLNTLVHQLSNGTYVNAGLINIPVPATIQWVALPLLNGWTDGAGVLAAMYAIFGGFLHLRGRISFGAATDDQFATIATAGNTGTIYTSGATDRVDGDLALDQEGLVQLSVGGAISLVGASSTLDGDRLMLDSIPPISIR